MGKRCVRARRGRGVAQARRAAPASPACSRRHSRAGVRRLDKFSYVAVLAGNTALTVLLCLRPAWMWAAYSVLALPLLGYRVWSYSRRGWSLFLYDYCYLANLLLLVHLLVPSARSSATVFKLAWASSFGPLAWATVAWRNSMVWHDLDKVTSVAIHLLPPIVIWCQRTWCTRGVAGAGAAPTRAPCQPHTSHALPHVAPQAGSGCQALRVRQVARRWNPAAPPSVCATSLRCCCSTSRGRRVVAVHHRRHGTRPALATRTCTRVVAVHHLCRGMRPAAAIRTCTRARRLRIL